jgi:tRNA/tmRNA/rRNA uracil-C5-methylase (TrmA/RlmC/RlmD family)
VAAARVGERLELEIGRVAHGGFCVARHEGQAVFVRHALPGERVLAEVTEVRARYLRADAVQVLAASPDRVTPPCPYARPGRCGGCDWQHVSLPAQRRLKASVVAEQLSRLAGLDVPVEVESVPGDDDGLGWRTRVRFAVSPTGAVGLHRSRSSVVQALDRCLIAHPLVNESGVLARRWRGAESVEVAVSAASGERSVTVRGERPRRGAALVEVVGGRRYRVSSGGFWQVHPGAASVLVECVLGMLSPRAGERVLDLYAGAGLFAGPLAEAVGPGGSVVAVEGDPRAAVDARHNLADLPQVRVLSGRLVDALPAGSAGDLVVLDPPRAGAGPALSAAIAALGARRVAYVACDPAALARDVAAFAAAGYRLGALRAFDLFPMTAHVECVALLEQSLAPRCARSAEL